MPTYVYSCTECDSVIEKNFPMSKFPEKIKCKCGSYAKKQICSVGWILKGNGDDWPSQQLTRKKQLANNNEAAGKKGYDYWKEKSPKLVKQ